MEELMQFESEIKESNLLKMDSPKEQSSYIKVLGVGGAGTNAVDHMFKSGIQGVDFIVCNTDQASLDRSPVSNKIKIGEGGLGAGNTPERARIAAEEAEEEIKSYFSLFHLTLHIRCAKMYRRLGDLLPREAIYC